MDAMHALFRAATDTFDVRPIHRHPSASVSQTNSTACANAMPGCWMGAKPVNLRVNHNTRVACFIEISPKIFLKSE